MSISDMMSGLMLIFLFISISFMIQVQSDKDKMKDIASSYKENKANLNEDLYSEFLNDLEKWDASITKDNTIVFNSPEVLFEKNSSDIKEGFKTILDDFFPRYINILSLQKYKEDIKEIRVEGHTSKDWNSETSKEEAYLNNMKLSQNRAFNVLSYCYAIDENIIRENRLWLEKYFRANGMSYAKLIYKNSENTIIDSNRSRRVEFTIVMESEDRIYKILE